MCGERVLRIIRDYIIKENLHIKQAMELNEITSDVMIDRDVLRRTIKKITGQQCSYDEIMKALDHFHKTSYEKQR